MPCHLDANRPRQIWLPVMSLMDIEQDPALWLWLLRKLGCLHVCFPEYSPGCGWCSGLILRIRGSGAWSAPLCWPICMLFDFCLRCSAEMFSLVRLPLWEKKWSLYGAVSESSFQARCWKALLAWVCLWQPLANSKCQIWQLACWKVIWIVNVWKWNTEAALCVSKLDTLVGSWR